MIQFTAITWLREFITLSGRTMLPFNAEILKAILPCMAYEQDKQNILLTVVSIISGRNTLEFRFFYLLKIGLKNQVVLEIEG